jgi:PAS domain S-box-containing protein
VRPDKSVRWLHVQTFAVHNSAGEVYRIAGIGEDISERKRVEEALRKSDLLLKTTVEASPIVLFTLDKQGIFQLSTGAGLKRLGLKPGEVVGQSAFEVYKDTPGILDCITRALKGETISNVNEVAGIAWDTRYVPMLDEDNTVEGVVGAAIDVTELIRAETEIRVLNVGLESRMRALDAERELNRRIIETSPVGITIYNEDGDCISANTAMERHIGASREQLLAQNYHRIESWKRHGIYDLAERARHSEQPLSGVFIGATTFGKQTWLGVTFCALQMDGHQHLMQMITDISEVMKAQRALEENERKYRSLVEQASDGIFLCAADGRYTDINQAGLDMLGYSREEVLARNLDAFIDEDDLRRMPIQLERLRTGEPMRTERRLRRKDGRIVIAEISARILPTDEILGIVRDVTTRKLAETELRLAASVFDNALDGIMITDAGYTIVAVNRAFTDITGYAAADAIGNNPGLLRSGQHDESFYEALRRAIRETGSWQGEIWDKRRTASCIASCCRSVRCATSGARSRTTARYSRTLRGASSRKADSNA